MLRDFGDFTSKFLRAYEHLIKLDHLDVNTLNTHTTKKCG